MSRADTFRELIPSEQFERLCRARDMLGDMFSESLRLRDAAREAELSPWHFLRQFQRAFGETPHAFLTRLRLDRARELLATSDRSVTDICFDVGFSSLGSFSTLFSRHVGCSPIRYRREIRTRVTVPGQWPWMCVPFCYARYLVGSGESVR